MSDVHKYWNIHNPPRLCDAYVRQYTKSSLVQIVACRLFSAIPLSGRLVSRTLRNKLQWNINPNKIISIISMNLDKHELLCLDIWYQWYKRSIEQCRRKRSLQRRRYTIATKTTDWNIITLISFTFFCGYKLSMVVVLSLTLCDFYKLNLN